MSSGWLNWGWYLIRMSYDNAIMSSGWHTLPFLSHPDEIANFDFSQHQNTRWPFNASVLPYDAADDINFTKIATFPFQCLIPNNPCLLHFGLVTSCGDKELGQQYSDNGLLPDGTKPLLEPALTCHHLDLMEFVSGQFHVTYFSHQSLKQLIIYLEFKSHLPAANELIHRSQTKYIIYEDSIIPNLHNGVSPIRLSKTWIHVHFFFHFKTMKPGDSNIHLWFRSSLVQVMACHMTWPATIHALTYLLFDFDSALAQGSDFESKGDKLSSSVECRIRTLEFWDTKSQVDWIPTHKLTELLGIKQKLELNSPSLWWVSIQPTWLHCRNWFTHGSGDIHIYRLILIMLWHYMYWLIVDWTNRKKNFSEFTLIFLTQLSFKNINMSSMVIWLNE